MNRRPSPLLTVCTLLATLALAAWLVRRFEDRAGVLRANHQQQLAALQMQWAREDAARKVAAHEEALTRQRAHQRELEQALGGPTEVPARNPDLNIKEMLEQTARACAPAGALVVVRVDRFTEFEAIVTLEGAPGSNQLAELTTCILRHGAPYVHSLRFIQGGRVIAELDQRALELVPDWSQASVTTAQALLASSGPAAPSPDAAANDAQPPSVKGETPELTGDRKRLQEVEDAFYRARTNQFGHLNKLIEVQDLAPRLASVGSVSALEDRQKWLGDNDSALDSARALLLDPEPEYRRRLSEQHFDPKLVAILCRGVSERAQPQRSYLTNLLAAVVERQRVAKSFLVTMQSQWGNWHADPAAGQILFDSPSAREEIGRASCRERV